jgi:hypothetical protein
MNWLIYAELISQHSPTLERIRGTGKKAHDPVELAPLVALGLAAVILGLARAELAKVLGRPGHRVLEELEGDTAEGFAWIFWLVTAYTKRKRIGWIR